MVSIGQVNWLQQGTAGGSRASGNYGYSNGEYARENTLQQRLTAIDKGDSTAIISGVSTNYSPQMNSGDDVMARIEAIGSGELSPRTNANFDMMA